MQKRFQNDENVYKAFLDILNMYRKEHKDINEVYDEVKICYGSGRCLHLYFFGSWWFCSFRTLSGFCFINFQVASLFGGHPDLLDEFTRFLPDTAHNTPLLQNSFLRFNERSSAAPTLQHMHMDKVDLWLPFPFYLLYSFQQILKCEQTITFFQQRIRRDRIITSHTDRNLSVDHPELDDDKAMVKMHKEHRRRTEKDSRDRRNHEQDEGDPDHDNNRDFKLQRFVDKRKSARKVEGFGVHANFPSYEDKDTLKSESIILG